MELRRCDHTHFIQAIRRGLVIKVRNTTRGRPALSFKSLKDVYESEDAKKLHKPPTVNSRTVPASSVFDDTHVGREVPCLPMVDRTLREIKPERDEFVPHSDGLDSDLDDDTTLKQLTKRSVVKKRKFGESDEHSNLAYADENPVDDKEDLRLPMVDRTLREVKSEKDEFVPHSNNGSDSDLDDDTTLKQLKEKFHGKKRKIGHIQEQSKQAYSIENFGDDEVDLSEPIINLRPKNPRRSKAKRKSMKGSGTSSSTTALNVKSEPILVSEGSLQVGGDLAPVIRVKVEDDTEELESQRKTPCADHSSFCNDVVQGGEVSNGNQNTTVQLELREPLINAEEQQSCVTNRISYDHLEDIEPISVFVPSDDMSDKLDSPDLHCHEFLDSPPLLSQKEKEIGQAHHRGNSPSDDRHSDVQMLSSSSSMDEISEQGSSDLRGLDMDTDCTNGCIGLRDELDKVQFKDNFKADSSHEQDDSPSTPNKNCSSSQNLVTSSKTNDSLVPMNITDEQNPVTCTLDDITKDGLNCRANMQDESVMTEKKHAPASPLTNADKQSSPKNQRCVSADTISTTEPCRPPERLPSTRKTISPSSQEQLCRAMNSVELFNDVDQRVGSERKVQLFEKETGKKDSSARSDIQQAKLAVNHDGHGQVSQRKVIISSRDIIKKSRKTKVNLEGPRFSRILPNLSSECTSIQGCSESAIAFSQRQMQDMESLATKLMDELDSMKCIVEQKLLFEAYRNASLKSDADEVKSAINSATKMEEIGRKWLSTMARDCKRFCKIMKMTPNGGSPSNDAVTREGKKIKFADEAGGKLCHVKYFEADVTTPVSDGSLEEKDRSI